MPHPDRPSLDEPPRPQLADHILSVVLPLSVIALGVALSASGAGRAFLEICRAALP